MLGIVSEVNKDFLIVREYKCMKSKSKKTVSFKVIQDMLRACYCIHVFLFGLGVYSNLDVIEKHFSKLCAYLSIGACLSPGRSIGNLRYFIL